ncbi:MAG: hypothetical protein ACOX52_21225 [Verrucomicrobiota bacterium]
MSESGSESESIPALHGAGPSWTAQTSLPSGVSTATAVPGFASPNPIPRSFDTDPDPDPDPECIVSASANS